MNGIRIRTASVDRAYRGAYRIAWPVVRFARRFYRSNGVSVAVWLRDGRLLVVQHSYKWGTWCPGGGIDRDEGPRDAVIRELREEVGEAVADAVRRAQPQLVSTFNYRRHPGTAYFFEVVLDREPALAIDHREITFAAFLTPEQIIEKGTGRQFAGYIAARSKRTRIDTVQHDQVAPGIVG